jgi:hypothetical protein
MRRPPHRTRRRAPRAGSRTARARSGPTVVVGEEARRPSPAHAAARLGQERAFRLGAGASSGSRRSTSRHVHSLGAVTQEGPVISVTAPSWRTVKPCGTFARWPRRSSTAFTVATSDASSVSRSTSPSVAIETVRRWVSDAQTPRLRAQEVGQRVRPRKTHAANVGIPRKKATADCSRRHRQLPFASRVRRPS